MSAGINNLDTSYSFHRLLPLFIQTQIREVPHMSGKQHIFGSPKRWMSGILEARQQQRY